jgi:hemoglobin
VLHGSLTEDQIFARIGIDGFTRLVRAFYAQVPADDILGPMYPPDDLAGAEERLRGFLIYRFGGPTDYIDQRGHPRLRMRHAPFAIDLHARDRWVQLMDRALEETALPADVTELLRTFFHDTATFMMNRR